ncbi:hypothetical protein CDG60_13375 [Acinetobacter chinensis]|uniref:Uncharacterized protein n=1 Tax=Acinetobacter chinensis TaxID=2004650 RepID=A0A3B7LYJ3_9GAMM|nr:hypothetical protein [Acinetobacter chinensis]AXY57468.1 hypothetical protein CDG60_13375 [Acinetobacter chinensis]
MSLLNVLLLICLVLVVVSGRIIWKKIRKSAQYRKRMLKDTKVVPAVVSPTDELRETSRVDDVDAFEPQLFDDIAALFFEQQVQIVNPAKALQIQENVLKKMPAKTVTRIRNMDLNEWSVYWSFYDQSLEYYVGRYGIFSTHVDRFGQEHKQEFTRSE